MFDWQALCKFRLRMQWVEVLGADNRWFCSQNSRRHVTDHNELWIHFIRSGGAADFCRRFEEAIGPVNRWYCSQFHRRDVREPEMLWHYYIAHSRHRQDPPQQPNRAA